MDCIGNLACVAAMAEHTAFSQADRRLLDRLFETMLDRAEEVIDLMASPDRAARLDDLARLGQELAQLAAAAALVAPTAK